MRSSLLGRSATPNGFVTRGHHSSLLPTIQIVLTTARYSCRDIAASPVLLRTNGRTQILRRRDFATCRTRPRARCHADNDLLDVGRYVHQHEAIEQHADRERADYDAEDCSPSRPEIAPLRATKAGRPLRNFLANCQLTLYREFR